MGEPTAIEFAPATAERIARNEDVFRSANERIRESGEEYDVEIPIPFVCECAEPTCREILRVDLDEYRRVRADPRWFLTAQGHQAASQGWGKVVAEHDGYAIVEKIGRAGEIAASLAGDDG
jgi:hypothetical protein